MIKYLETKIIKGVKIFFLNIDLTYQEKNKTLQKILPKQLPDLKTAVFLKQENLIQIWVDQPFFGDFEISYEDSDFFDKILKPQNNLERTKTGFAGFITSSLFAKDAKILSFATQNTFKHKEIDKNGFCYRERLRHKNLLKSGEGYELCDGCNSQNHSEALAIQKFLENKNIQNLQNQCLQNSLKNCDAYIYGHFWSCSSCSQKMKKMGVQKIIFCKKWVESLLEI
jgi:Cytidine and deoxycytidylate deaminase zinc-binding region